jgi:NADPH2:quinone reductase
MRAVVVDTPGDLDRLRLEERPVPRPGPGEVAIEVAYAGCNWGDVQKRQGIYPDPVAYPACLGAEVSGFVAARGKGVTRLRLEQFVSAITGPDMLRGFADVVVVPDKYVIPLPPEFDARLAAAFPIVSLTAYHLIHTAHRIRRGETILVHAIGGAVGLMLTQLASAAGAHVLGTVGSLPKAARPLELGARHVVSRDHEDFVVAAMAQTRGRGVDLVIDSLGGDILERSFDAVRPFGRVISIGEASGEPSFPIRKKLYERSTSLSGFEVLHARPGSRRWRRSTAAIVDALAAGTLTVPIAKVFPLAEIRKAQAFLEGRTAAGKVLIAVNG